jgi:NAD(P)-dependent dehydrogenase (short-subunit alcohol dehydrogenase family)
MPVAHDFKNKIALITGGAAGIGLATALAFAKAGADVIIADFDAARGSEAVQQIESLGRSALFHLTDLTDERAIDALFNLIEARFGTLDYAHNNVGFGWGSGLVGTTREDWDKTLSLCLTAPFLCLKREVALMSSGKAGAIVNTASMAATRYTDVASAAYVAAKAGVIALTRYAAVAHAKDGIRINAVSPGLVSTEAVSRFMTAEQQNSFASKEQPIGRPVTTDEVAQTVLWLCSDAAAMVTGDTISVAGGQQAL